MGDLLEGEEQSGAMIDDQSEEGPGTGEPKNRIS